MNCDVEIKLPHALAAWLEVLLENYSENFAVKSEKTLLYNVHKAVHGALIEWSMKEMEDMK